MEEVEPRTVIKPQVIANHDVVEHRKRQTEPGALKRAGDTSAINLLRADGGDPCPDKLDQSAARRIDAGENIEAARLACAVGTNHHADFSFLDIEPQSIDLHEPAPTP